MENLQKNRSVSREASIPQNFVRPIIPTGRGKQILGGREVNRVQKF